MSIRSIVTRGFGDTFGAIKDIITRGFVSGLSPDAVPIDFDALKISFVERGDVSFEERLDVSFVDRRDC